MVWDDIPWVEVKQVTAMTSTYDTNSMYDPTEHRATGKEVKSGWILVVLINLGLVILTL